MQPLLPEILRDRRTDLWARVFLQVSVWYCNKDKFEPYLICAIIAFRACPLFKRDYKLIVKGDPQSPDWNSLPQLPDWYY